MSTPADSNGGDPLDAVVAVYLQRAEAGNPPDRDAVVAAHPDLADRLRAFFADLDRMGARGAAFRLPDVALPGDFGDYEFLSELGRGGMGVVYRVRQKSLGRVVALKMVLSGPLADAAALQRFREEAETLSHLDHPHVVPVYDVGEHRGLPYFTMKLIEGQSLTRCLGRYAGDRLAAVVLLRKVCGAVQHAHARGVLHRDLKPGNILVDAAGEPHVTDFGLARRVEDPRTLTTTGAVLGTPEYMAPEQAAGVKDVTTAADVYGLGGVLHALLTGRPPFHGPTVYDTLRRVIEDEPVYPAELAPVTPPELVLVCLTCLRKDPARRYRGVAEVAEDLRRYLLGKRLAARPPGRVERLYRWSRRKPTLAALYAATTAAVVLIGFSAVVARLWWTAEDAREATASALGKVEAEGIEKERALLAEEQARRAEEKARLAAERAREKAAATLAASHYSRMVLNALAKQGQGDVDAAVNILFQTPPEMRGWEWRYAHRRCRGMIPVTTHPEGQPALGPDGSPVFTPRDGNLAVWFDRVTSGKSPEEPSDQFPPKRSPNGTRSVTRDENANQFHLWDEKTGAEIAVFKSSGWRWSPDGSRFLTCVAEKGWQIRDAKTGAEIATLTGNQPRWSPDGNSVLTQWKGEAHVWDGRTGTAVTTFGAPDQGWGAMAEWSPDGMWLVTGPRRGVWGTYRLYEARAKGVLTTLDGLKGGLKVTALSPDWSRILTVPEVETDNQTVSVWNTRTGTRIATLTGHKSKVNDARWSPDGSRIATASDDGTARVWDATTGEAVVAITVNDFGEAPSFKEVEWAWWNPDGTRLLTSQRRGYYEWDAASGAPLGHRNFGLREWVLKGPVRWLEINGSYAGSIGNTFISDLDGEDVRKCWGVWSHDRVLAAACVGKTVRVWNVQDQKGQRVAEFPGVGIFLDSWSLDDSKVITRLDDKSVGVCDIRTGEQIAVLREYTAKIESVAWNPEGTRVVTVNGDGVVRVWDARTGADLLTLEGNTRHATEVVWSPDGTRVMARSQWEVWTWDTSPNGPEFLLKPVTPKPRAKP